GGYTTGIGLINMGNTSTDVTITYRDPNGSVTSAQSLTAVPAHAYRGVYSGDAGQATDARLPNNFAGTATITSSTGGSLAAIVNEVAPAPANGPQQSTSYNTFATGSGSVHLPLVESAGTDGWSTGLGIMNTGTTATAVTVSYFDASTGQPVGTPASNASLAPNAFWGVYQPNSGLPAGTRATAVVRTAAGGSAVAVCDERADPTLLRYH